MCGRYQLGIDGKNRQFGYRFNIGAQQTLQLKDNYNIAPSQTVPIIVNYNSNTIQKMLWGLIPSWSQDGKSLVINARSETIKEKPMFKHLLMKRRCIIPSTGYYEWKKTNDGKQPYYIGLKDHDFFGLAGLYDIWKDQNGEDLYSFAIMTCAPNNTTADIHNRMPVILQKDNEDKWLNPHVIDERSLLPLLTPYPENLMIAYPISSRVNSPLHNDNGLEKPIS